VGTIYVRNTKLWLRHKGPDGKWTQSNTPYHVGDEKLARQLLARVEAKVAAGTAFADEIRGPVTVASLCPRFRHQRTLDVSLCP
jgi:hypothetical protein